MAESAWGPSSLTLVFKVRERRASADLSVASVVPMRTRGLGAGMDCRATAGE